MMGCQTNNKIMKMNYLMKTLFIIYLKDLIGNELFYSYNCNLICNLDYIVIIKNIFNKYKITC